MDKRSMYIGPVAGTSFEPAKTNLRDMVVALNEATDDHPFKLKLVTDPHNKYDSNAIKVVADFESKEYFVGWVPRDYNHNICKQIKNSLEEDGLSVGCELEKFNVFDDRVVGLEIDISLIRE